MCVCVSVSVSLCVCVRVRVLLLVRFCLEDPSTTWGLGPRVQVSGNQSSFFGGTGQELCTLPIYVGSPSSLGQRFERVDGYMRDCIIRSTKTHIPCTSISVPVPT